MLKLIFFNEVSERLCLSKRHLRRLWQAGLMPEPIRVSPRRLAWRVETLAAWLESRAANQEPAADADRVEA